jgi:hypothetical protein
VGSTEGLVPLVPQAARKAAIPARVDPCSMCRLLMGRPSIPCFGCAIFAPPALERCLPPALLDPGLGVTPGPACVDHERMLGQPGEADTLARPLERAVDRAPGVLLVDGDHRTEPGGHAELGVDSQVRGVPDGALEQVDAGRLFIAVVEEVDLLGPDADGDVRPTVNQGAWTTS